jgi:hypothetical protein
MAEATKELPAGAKRKPPAAGMGRPKGTLNKTTRALKEAILLAAEEVGEDGIGKDGTVGYLKHLAMKEPVSFASLLGKVLPLTLAGDPDNPLHVITAIERSIVKAQPTNG